MLSFVTVLYAAARDCTKILFLTPLLWTTLVS